MRWPKNGNKRKENTNMRISPSPISLMVSVDVKHHVYLLTGIVQSMNAFVGATVNT